MKSQGIVVCKHKQLCRLHKYYTIIPTTFSIGEINKHLLYICNGGAHKSGTNSNFL